MIEREIVFEDRTPAHADHVGFGFERKTTAAVGEYISKHRKYDEDETMKNNIQNC